jgi:hypothetical protein
MDNYAKFLVSNEKAEGLGMKRSGMTNTLRRLVRRWWGMGLFLCLCAAWVVWCMRDPLAFMFWLPLAVAAIPAALSIPPNH